MDVRFAILYGVIAALVLLTAYLYERLKLTEEEAHVAHRRYHTAWIYIWEKTGRKMSVEDMDEYAEQIIAEARKKREEEENGHEA